MVGDIATVTVQLMWGSPRGSGSDLMGGDLPPVNVIGFSYEFPSLRRDYPRVCHFLQ